MREQRGVVIYVRSAYPELLEGSVFVALEPPFTLPFHLAVRRDTRNPGVDVLIEAARDLRQLLLEDAVA